LAGNLSAEFSNGIGSNGDTYTVGTFATDSTGSFASTAGVGPAFTSTITPIHSAVPRALYGFHRHPEYDAWLLILRHGLGADRNPCLIATLLKSVQMAIARVVGRLISQTYARSFEASPLSML
jgi:hypothetical protein